MKRNVYLSLFCILMSIVLAGCTLFNGNSNNKPGPIPKNNNGVVIEISEDNKDISDNSLDNGSEKDLTDDTVSMDSTVSSNEVESDKDKEKKQEENLTVSEKMIERIISEMSLEEKINQMMILEFRKWDDGKGNLLDFEEMNADVRKIVAYHKPGGVILFSNNLKSVDKAFDLITEFQDAAISKGGQPLLTVTDQEGGKVSRVGHGTMLPGNMAIAATGNVQNAYKAGKVIGSELISLGINTDLAPVVDVNTNPLNPVIGVRAFSDDPQIVSSYAAEMIRGMSEYGVISCLKHFPGHGDTALDSHYELAKVNKTIDEIKKCELLPYEKLIDKVDLIMTAHILFPEIETNTKYSNKTGKEEHLVATMSDDILTGLLKQEMGFEGIVITDAMNMKAVTDKWDPVQAIELSIDAGADMICIPVSISSKQDIAVYDEIIDGLIECVNNDDLSENRIDDAVRRILRVKYKNGILDFNFNDYSMTKAVQTVGCENNKKIEEEIASLAVTTVENKGNLLPLNLYSDSKVLMLAPKDEELSQLALGWNRAVSELKIPSGAEVRILKIPDSNEGQGYSNKTEIETFIEWADYIIMLSEMPDSVGIETFINSILYKNINDNLKYAKKLDKSVIIISCDVPYDTVLYDDADAILAAYGKGEASIDASEALISGVTYHDGTTGFNIIASVQKIFGVTSSTGRMPVSIPEYDVSSGLLLNNKVKYPRGYMFK